jgi:flagellar hook-associated protein 3 FlgL
MRLTNNMIMRKYMANLNTSLTTLNNLNEQTSSGMKFSKMSEDPATALKAFQVRRNLSQITLYKSNVLDTQNSLSDIEFSISNLNNTLSDINAQIIQGRTGTYNASDKIVIANTLKDMQQQILEISNSKFSGKFIFGGPNVKQPPFTLDATSKLLYNGVNVDTGTFTNEAIYVDIGLGLSTDTAGNIIPQSAFNKSHPGSELLGTGVDADGISNNLYNVVGEIAKMFQNNDFTNIDKYVNKFSKNVEEVMVQYANVGEKSKSLEYLSNRLDTDENNALHKQNDLEAVDLAKSILDFKNQESSYNAALQMGAKILQLSLVDYLR